MRARVLMVHCLALVALAGEPASAGFVRSAHWTSGNAALWGEHAWNDPVVSLTVTDNFNELHYLSGVYLGGAIVTSGHGLDFGGGRYATSITVRTGYDIVNNPWETVSTTSYLVHPDYDPGAGSGRSTDLALVYCSLMSVSAAVYATTPPSFGTEVEQAGFGLIYTLEDGLQEPMDYSLKIGGRNRLRSPDPLYPGYLMTSWNRLTGFPEEWGGAPGDSGGPWWENRGGSRVLVACTTFTTGQHAGSLNGGVDIAAHSPWITAHIPAPGAVVLFGLGGVLSIMRRRSASSRCG